MMLHDYGLGAAIYEAEDQSFLCPFTTVTGVCHASFSQSATEKHFLSHKYGITNKISHSLTYKKKSRTFPGSPRTFFQDYNIKAQRSAMSKYEDKQLLLLYICRVTVQSTTEWSSPVVKKLFMFGQQLSMNACTFISKLLSLLSFVCKQELQHRICMLINLNK